MTERRRVQVDGAAVRYLEAGPAGAEEAVVFVHGNPGSADDWASLAAAVGASGRRALAADLPDFGETEAPRGFDNTATAYAAFLGRTLEELGARRVHLVLHDFGGPIGLFWAMGSPDSLASIALIDTGILPGYRPHRMARLWRTPVVGELVQATTTRRLFRRAIDRGEPRGLPAEFTARMAEQFDRRTKRAVLRLYRSSEDPTAASESLAALMAPRDLPALVIWGGGDHYLPAAYAERQREAFPSAEVHVLAESGHWPFVDDPDAAERLLLDFLAAR